MRNVGVGRLGSTLKRGGRGGSLAGPKLLGAFRDEYPTAFFIEIGSNDGEQHDHLRPIILSSAWSGIMIEPVPYVFDRLRANYGDLERVALENVAIADRDGRLPFYHLAQAAQAERPDLPRWYDGIGSFSLEGVLGHANHIPDIERRVVHREVPCLTFESLCRKHDVRELDLLLIDTEGYDHQIIRQLDFEVRRPRLLIYEHFHLASGERKECRERLAQAQYETMEEGFDTWCLDIRNEDRLTAAWRRLKPAIPGLSVHDRAP